MRILGIETSCDETAASVVDDGRWVVANVVASQMRVHRPYQGVVPELASRCHIEYMLPVVEEALRLAGIGPDGDGIDAVAVTRGPGLIGALLVGVETAKTLAWRWGKPLIPVHHTVGHLHSVFCELPEGQSRLLEIIPEGDSTKVAWTTDSASVSADAEQPNGESGGNPKADGSLSTSSVSLDKETSEGFPLLGDRGRGEAARAGANAQVSPDQDSSRKAFQKQVFDYPYIGLAISGGHSNLIRANSPRDRVMLGGALDDAPGEAYDKVAKVLGLEYPGGPVIDRLAAQGDPKAFDLPRPIFHSKDYNFSFSGLKTAVIRTIEDYGGLEKIRASETALQDICASFQAAVIDVLLKKTERALHREHLSRLAVVGGVACNRGLRTQAALRLKGIHLVFPPPILCTDNAAMIAAVAEHLPPASPEGALCLDARSGLEIE